MKLRIFGQSAFVALRDARLCTDCEFITPASSDRCSVCGSPSVISLSHLLTGIIGESARAPETSRLAKLAESTVA
jgi:RNA polymerase subunit RPABC4/transcription elongation factor Spt4